MRKSILLLFCLLAISSLHNDTQAQGFSAPSDSNAVVYFVRVSNFSRSSVFDFFHESNLIGSFGDANYMRYECTAGKNIFWASSENKQFLNCELKAGGTYLVLVNIKVGSIKSKVTLTPITEKSMDFNRVVAFVNENECLIMSPEKIDVAEAKLNKRGFIAHNLKKYEKKWIDTYLTKIISPDLAIPVSYLD